jgi:hypothetical protein
MAGDMSLPRPAFLMLRPWVMLCPALLLAGCGGDSTAPVKSASASVPRPRVVRTPARPPVRAAPPAPRVQTLPGVEGVIGANGDDLVRQFGTPRLDVMEGDARKLQYSGNACVLDIYLYPPAPGREPQATYVDARRASDAQAVDRAACIAALRGR